MFTETTPDIQIGQSRTDDSDGDIEPLGAQASEEQEKLQTQSEENPTLHTRKDGPWSLLNKDETSDQQSQEWNAMILEALQKKEHRG